MGRQATTRAGTSPVAAPLDAVTEFFDSEAARYDRDHDVPGPSRQWLLARLQAVLRLVGEGPGEVLDVGMGPGRLCSELARRGWTASGIDSSHQMVARARARMPEAESRLRQGRAEALPFDDRSFDAVVATGVLEYVQDRPAALREISRVLREGGRAVISVPNDRALYSLWYWWVFYPVARLARRLRRHPRRPRPPGGGRLRRARLERMLTAAGLKVELVEYRGFALFVAPLDLMFPRTAARLAERLEGSGPRLGRVLATQLVFAAQKDRAAA
jgi:ubiquinone/menaquinone biosynthesis C-methylase UbiE